MGAAFFADKFGRKPLMWLFLIGSAVMTPITYLWPGGVGLFILVAAINGVFTLGGFVWMPLYLPELFATSVRSTAISTVFNSTRLVAWLGPVLTGTLVGVFGGIAPAAMWMARCTSSVCSSCRSCGRPRGAPYRSEVGAFVS